MSVVSYEVYGEVVCGEVGATVVSSMFGDRQVCSLFANTCLSQATISASSFSSLTSTVTTKKEYTEGCVFVGGTVGRASAVSTQEA